MNKVGWELFLRTGLPQAYTFAKAAEHGNECDPRQVQVRRKGKEEKR